MKFLELVENTISEMAKAVLPDGREFRSSEAAVIQLTGEGKNVREIAAELRTSVESVASIISVAKRKGTWPEEYNKPKFTLHDGRTFGSAEAAVIELVGEGKTLAEVADLIGSTKASVASIVSIAKRKGTWPENLQVVRAPRAEAQPAEVAPEAQPEPEVAASSQEDYSEYDSLPLNKLWYFKEDSFINVANPDLTLHIQQIDDNFKVFHTGGPKARVIKSKCDSFAEAKSYAADHIASFYRGVLVSEQYAESRK